MRIRTDSDGFITAVGLGLTDYDHEIDTDKDIEPADPSKHEKAWHWNGGNPELRDTGYTPPPTTEERVENLEKAAGVNGAGKQGIAQRIDELEQRVSDLENSS